MFGPFRTASRRWPLRLVRPRCPVARPRSHNGTRPVLDLDLHGVKTSRRLMWWRETHQVTAVYFLGHLQDILLKPGLAGEPEMPAASCGCQYFHCVGPGKAGGFCDET